MEASEKRSATTNEVDDLLCRMIQVGLVFSVNVFGALLALVRIYAVVKINPRRSVTLNKASLCYGDFVVALINNRSVLQMSNNEIVKIINVLAKAVQISSTSVTRRFR